MESAALFLLASGLGVVFGWQPMPDGSSRYEYIVQLEPELIATLEAGQSIPITSDIPAEIGPIGRIRIVVGQDDLPRQKLTTRLKPAAADEGKQPRDGVIETQFTLPAVRPDGNERYPNQPATTTQILPPADDGATGSDPFARALQRGAQQARNNATQESQILPPGNQGPTVDQYGRPPRERSIVTTTDNRTAPGGGVAPAFDNRRGSASILPPASTGAPPVATNPITPPTPRIDQPMPSVTRNDWQASGPTRLGANTPPPSDAAPNPSSRRGLFDAPWPPIVRHDDQQPTPATEQENWPSQTTRDLFDVANRPPNRDRTEGPNFPPATPTANTTWPAQPPATPEIRRDMLDQPATADVQVSNGQPVATDPLPPAQNEPWPIDRQPTASNTQPVGADSTKVFPLLLSWVLLSGSGAGNLYLFWSYLDVRNKYRGLAYNTRREGGGRSSYED